MGPWLFFVTLLGLTFLVHGQTEGPPPPPPLPPGDLSLGDIPTDIILQPTDDGGVAPSPMNIQPAVPESSPTDGPLTSLAGNIQVIYNDQLRAIMKDYDITPDEIRKMLDLYAKGGSPTITKSRTNPDTGLQEVITLDFEQFTTKSPSGDDSEPSRVKSVSPSALPLPGQTTPISKPGDGPSDTSPPRQNTLADLQDAAAYIRNQIIELDSQLLALDRAYRTGQITRLTRNQNAVGNRERRRQLEGDLRLLLREISMMTRPQARRDPPREVSLGSGPISPLDRDIQRLERENRMLEAQLRGDDDSRSTSTSEVTRVQQPSVRPAVLPRQVGSTSASYEALGRELLQIRARERYILRRLQMLAARNPRLRMRGRMPNQRNVLLRRPPMVRRINFSNAPQQPLRRTLTGSVSAGRPRPQNPRMRFF